MNIPQNNIEPNNKMMMVRFTIRKNYITKFRLLATSSTALSTFNGLTGLFNAFSTSMSQSKSSRSLLGLGLVSNSNLDRLAKNLGSNHGNVGRDMSMWIRNKTNSFWMVLVTERRTFRFLILYVIVVLLLYSWTRPLLPCLHKIVWQKLLYH